MPGSNPGKPANTQPALCRALRSQVSVTRTRDVKKAKQNYCNGNCAKKLRRPWCAPTHGHTAAPSPLQGAPGTGLPRFYLQAHPSEIQPPFLSSYLLLGLQDLLVHGRHKNGPAVMIHAVKLYFAQRHLFIQLQPGKGTALGSQICPWFLPSCQSCSHAY